MKNNKDIHHISVEEFAAYLDGNLSVEEMNIFDSLATANPDVAELISISDEVDEDIQTYMQDEFAYNADMTALEDSCFDIPNLELDNTLHPLNYDYENKEALCADNIIVDTLNSCDSHDYNNDKTDDNYEVDNNSLINPINDTHEELNHTDSIDLLESHENDDYFE